MKRGWRILAAVAALHAVHAAAGEPPVAPFDFMIAVTRQDSSMDWWFAVPAQFSPQISTIGSVVKGEYFNIIPVFRNYGVASNGEAHIDYDIKIIRPDASVYEKLDGCDGHCGPASPPDLIPARAVLHLCFDPEDPYGEYEIQVAARDRVAGTGTNQTARVRLREFELPSVATNEHESVFINYPVSPDPCRALACFLRTPEEFLGDDGEPIWSAVHFYRTVFEENGFLIPQLVRLFDTVPEKARKDIILVLALMGKGGELPPLPEELAAFRRQCEAIRVPDPYTEITTGEQLDMLWAEYFATGRIRPIGQMLTALRLSRYMGTLDKVKAGKLDLKAEGVEREAMLEAVFQSALWSIRSNCRQSPLLYHYCVGLYGAGELDGKIESVLGMILKSQERGKD